MQCLEVDNRSGLWVNRSAKKVVKKGGPSSFFPFLATFFAKSWIRLAFSQQSAQR